MKKILLTGGAGYIGSVLTGFLLDKGYAVTIVDNFMYGQNSLANYFKNKNFFVIKSDVRNIKNYNKEIKSSDIIIPLAALVGAPICKQDPIGAKSVNFDAVKNLFKIVSKKQILLMPTTNSAYGSGNKKNFCDEDSELKPLSEYAIDKVEIEKMLMDYENSISLRLATVFGMSPRMRVDLLVNDFVNRAIGDGSIVLYESYFKRNYIHVMDVARAFLHCLDNFSLMKSNIYNVGLSSANLSKKELCLKIKKHVKKLLIIESNLFNDPDQRNYIVSNKKIEKTGFRPIYDIDFGIVELIKGLKCLKINNYSNF